MSFLTEHWLEAGVGIFLLSAVLYGHYRGFVKMVMSVATLVLSLIVVRIVVPAATGILRANTGIRRAVGRGLLHMSGLEDGGIGLSISIPAQQRQSIEGLKLPTQIKEILLENNTHEIYSLLGVDTFLDYLGASLANMVLKVIVSAVMFVLVYCLIKLIMKWLDLITRLPVLSGMNQIAGALLGGVQGLCIVWAGGMVLELCSAMKWAQPVLTQIERSVWLSFLYDYNIFNKLIFSVMNNLG